MPYLQTIETALPEFEHLQANILDFMLATGQFSENEGRRLSLMYHRSGIDKRFSVLKDYSVSPENFGFFPASLEPFPGLSQRMVVFEHEAVELAAKAIIKIDGYKSVTHLITVSCTGLMAPGLDILLVEKLGLAPNIHRSSVNFMGCYAAIHALKTAHAYCVADPTARVLVVCVELCTLHFQKGMDMDTLTSNLLFADGAAACLVGSEPVGYQIDGFYSELALAAKNDMTWRLSESGFLMTLSQSVPKTLEKSIQNLITNALLKNNSTVESIQNWAIHPGGKSILEAIQKAMNIEKSKLGVSTEVLKNHGNMSSATLLFVLQKMMQDLPVQKTFAVAFGPGLTMESMLLS